MRSALAILVLCVIGCPLVGCRETLPPADPDMAPRGAEHPQHFSGELEETGVYDADVVLDQASGTYKTVIPLSGDDGPAAHLEWANLDDFPELASRQLHQARLVFEAVSSDQRTYPEDGTTHTWWTCRILGVH